MTNPQDRRLARRAILGAEHAISFRLKGRDYREVRITNLSPGGCFALVPAGDAGRFTRGSTLEDLILEHPDLPKGPISAVVSYVLGGHTGEEPLDLVGIGIQFLGMAPAEQTGLQAWVNQPMAP